MRPASNEVERLRHLLSTGKNSLILRYSLPLLSIALELPAPYCLAMGLPWPQKALIFAYVAVTLSPSDGLTIDACDDP
jgi:hypothetical protein